jgi:hypothetical protein
VNAGRLLTSLHSVEESLFHASSREIYDIVVLVGSTAAINGGGNVGARGFPGGGLARWGTKHLTIGGAGNSLSMYRTFVRWLTFFSRTVTADRSRDE